VILETLPLCLDVSAILQWKDTTKIVFRKTVHSLIILRCGLYNFSIDVPEVVLDDFVNRAFNFQIVLIFGQLTRCSGNSSQISAGMVPLLLVIEEPRSELLERIVRIVNCC
jgi:hypothetical protein